MRESNSHQRFWRPLSYHLTNPLYACHTFVSDDCLIIVQRKQSIVNIKNHNFQKYILVIFVCLIICYSPDLSQLYEVFFMRQNKLSDRFALICHTCFDTTNSIISFQRCFCHLMKLNLKTC